MEFEELCILVVPIVQAHAKAISEAHILPGWLIKLILDQHLLQFILYMKHENVVVYDVFMWNWSKYAICDDAIFIASYINDSIGDKVWWPS